MLIDSLDSACLDVVERIIVETEMTFLVCLGFNIRKLN